jgi:hypothetical protein
MTCIAGSFFTCAHQCEVRLSQQWRTLHRVREGQAESTPTLTRGKKLGKVGSEQR